MTPNAPLELVPDPDARSTRATGTAPLPYVRASDVLVPAAADEIVEGLLSRSSIAVLYGASGCGKTFLGVHLAGCIATERQFLGRGTRRQPVAYFAAEAGRSAGNRFLAWRNEFLSDVQPLELPVALVTCALDLRNDLSIDADAMIATIRELEAGVAMLDTFNAAFAGGDENSSADVGASVTSLRRVVDATGVSLVVVHHAGKVQANGMRGHSLFHAAADVVVEVTNTEGTIGAKVVKHRDAPLGDELFARLRRVDLGATDSWGRPMTSCVLDDGAAAALPQTRGRIPKGATLVLRALTEAISEHGQPLPATNGIPPGRRGVLVRQWRERYYTLDPLDSDEPADAKKATEARQKRFARGLRDLQEAGAVGVLNVHCWVNR
jgi:hypothetical protein